MEITSSYREFPDSLVEATAGWLREPGVEFFRRNKDNMIMLHRFQGMDVRNWLRTCHECEGWTPQELDDTWIDIVLKSIEYWDKEQNKIKVILNEAHFEL